MWNNMRFRVKSEPRDDPGQMGALVDVGSSPLMPSQDPSEAENAKEYTNAEEKEGESSEESSDDGLPSVSQLAELTRKRPLRKKRQRKDYTKILPRVFSITSSKQTTLKEVRLSEYT
jgi:hypothetical protein